MLCKHFDMTFKIVVIIDKYTKIGEGRPMLTANLQSELVQSSEFESDQCGIHPEFLPTSDEDLSLVEYAI